MSRLKGMTERARIEYYVTKFMDYVEAEDYENAYDLLNNDYKNNYFQSRTKFEEYADKNFSKMMDIDYTNFERSGDVYVIWMTVTDAINGGPNSGKEFNFVVKENDYNAVTSSPPFGGEFQKKEEVHDRVSIKHESDRQAVSRNTCA